MDVYIYIHVCTHVHVHVDVDVGGNVCVCTLYMYVFLQRAVEAERSRVAAEMDRLASFEASEASLRCDMLMSMNTT